MDSRLELKVPIPTEQICLIEIVQIPPLSQCSALQQLEVSYNEIRSMQTLTELPTGSLQEFFAASNKIKTIEVNLPS